MPARDVATIIVAAGSGNRFGGPKQFEELGGLQLFQYVARTFAVLEPMRMLIVVGREEDLYRLESGMHELNPPCEWRVVPGGATRQVSVRNGLEAARALPDVEIVLVHDCARALIDDVTILKVVGGAREHGSAIAAVPVVDTIKRVVDGEIVETISRSQLWRAQTPQGARLMLLLTAYAQGRTEGAEATDESELLERIGEQPLVVPGTELNFKITFPEDMIRAREIVRYREHA